AENNAQAQAELKMIMEQLQKIAPHLTHEFNLQKDALSLNTDEVRKYAQELRRLSDEQRKILSEQLGYQLQDQENVVKKARENLEKAEQAYKEAQQKVQLLMERFGATTEDNFKEALQRALASKKI